MKTAVLTVGQMADKLGQPPSRINYAISKLRIKPVARVANIRLFYAATVERMRKALKAEATSDGS